jgi:hypothetical protein
MPTSDELTERVRALLAPLAEDDHVDERRMFGGVSFMLRGNFSCGVNGDDVVVRVGPERYAEALARPHAREMDFTGRPMSGWVFVAATALGDTDLSAWLAEGVAFARTLPAK